MLENLVMTNAMEREAYKEQMVGLKLRMGDLQRQCKELGIPVLIVFDGVDAAGKGLQIGKLLEAMDPRGFKVFTVKKETKNEKFHPFLWRYWDMLPQNGSISILDGSWYQKVVSDVFEEKVVVQDKPIYYEEIRSFEKQLASSGMNIIKLFLYIDKDEQKKRMKKLLNNESTAWRVTKEEQKKNKNFDVYRMLAEEAIKESDTEYAPWNLIAAIDRRYTTVQIYRTIISYLEAKIKEVNMEKSIQKYVAKEESYAGPDYLGTVDLNKELDEETYEVRLKELQKKMEYLHGDLYRKRIPLVIGFEGWDAGGKGGAIKRLTEKMDPRGFVVHPVSAPNDIEKKHHYLWRFWKNMPKAGHIAIFDRTWYGRVMVERIERFCTTKDWKRAYKEINDMERSLVNAGAIVLKFWLHVDKDEQEARFIARQNNPEKQWKITDEDWRNRAKWDEYKEAVNEMIDKTSKEDSPWIIVEGNDKKYARIKVLETVIEAIERRMK